MANQKISELTDLSTSVATADTLVLVDATDTTTKKVSISNTIALAPMAKSTSAYVATDEHTHSTNWADLTTGGPAVTVTTGTKVLVTLHCGLYGTQAFNRAMSFAISGATTVSAATGFHIGTSSTAALYVGVSFVVTGLTAGSNTFTAKYMTADGSDEAHFLARRITVTPLD